MLLETSADCKVQWGFSLFMHIKGEGQNYCSEGLPLFCLVIVVINASSFLQTTSNLICNLWCFANNSHSQTDFCFAAGCRGNIKIKVTTARHEWFTAFHWFINKPFVCDWAALCMRFDHLIRLQSKVAKNTQGQVFRVAFYSALNHWSPASAPNKSSLLFCSCVLVE
jgi:hypothetical protein